MAYHKPMLPPPYDPNRPTLEAARRLRVIEPDDTIGLFLAVHWPSSQLYELYKIVGREAFEKVMRDLEGYRIRIPARLEFEKAVRSQRVYEAVEQERGTVLGLAEVFGMSALTITRIHERIRSRTLDLVRLEDTP